VIVLQTGPDTSNILLAGVVGLALLASAVAIVAVVSRDAAARGVSKPRRWLIGVGAALFPVPVFVAYILFRISDRRACGAGTPNRPDRRLARRQRSDLGPRRRDLSPPDPVTQLRYAAGLFVALAALFYIPTFRRGPLVGGA